MTDSINVMLYAFCSDIKLCLDMTHVYWRRPLIMKDLFSVLSNFNSCLYILQQIELNVRRFLAQELQNFWKKLHGSPTRVNVFNIKFRWWDSFGGLGKPGRGGRGVDTWPGANRRLRNPLDVQQSTPIRFNSLEGSTHSIRHFLEEACKDWSTLCAPD